MWSVIQLMIFSIRIVLKCQQKVKTKNLPFMKNICGIGAWKSVKGFLLHEKQCLSPRLLDDG